MNYKMQLFYGIKDSMEQYKYEEAKSKLESFLVVYQFDLFALSLYAQLLIFEGSKGIEEAELIFKKIIKEAEANIKEDVSNSKKKIKNEKIINETILNLIYLNIEKNDYDAAYNYLMFLDKSSAYDYINNDLRASILKHKGIMDIEPLYYLEKQQIEYNYEKAVNNIKGYHQNSALEQKTIKFGEDVDINRLMNLVKPFLIKENRLHIYDLYDSYLFKSNKIGHFYQNRCIIDFFMVKTIKGTDNIVSMFPIKTPSHVNLDEADNIIDINDIELAFQKLKRKKK